MDENPSKVVSRNSFDFPSLFGKDERLSPAERPQTADIFNSYGTHTPGGASNR
jgi:hypothetical protein